MLGVISCTLFSGCSSIINGRRQTVAVTSNPPGATVSDGKQSWTTPATIQLERNRDHLLTFSKDGFETQTVVLNHAFSGVVATNIFLGPFWLLGWGTDAISGAQYRLVPETVNIQLRSLLKQEIAQADPVETQIGK
jgi:hypothetical protein